MSLIDITITNLLVSDNYWKIDIDFFNNPFTTHTDTKEKI